MWLVQVKRDFAWHYKAYQRVRNAKDFRGYAEAEDAARTARRGLWAGRKPVLLWEYRQAGQANYFGITPTQIEARFQFGGPKLLWVLPATPVGLMVSRVWQGQSVWGIELPHIVWVFWSVDDRHYPSKTSQFLVGVNSYLSKRIGIETYIALSPKEEDDLAGFSAYYADKRGCHPELQGDIRFVPARAAAR